MDKKLKKSDSQSSLHENTTSVENLLSLNTKSLTSTITMDPELNKSFSSSSKSNKQNISLDIAVSPTDISEPSIKLFEDEAEHIKTKKRVIHHKISTKTPKKKKRKAKYKRNRCYICKKKIGLSPILCICGFSYCGNHRATSSHKCNFNKKEQKINQLREENPCMVTRQIDII